MWAMFMLSAGLTQTGVANVIGRHVLKFAGTGEIRIVTIIMVTSGVLSAFMNNIGVAALMLPVVMVTFYLRGVLGDDVDVEVHEDTDSI